MSTHNDWTRPARRADRWQLLAQATRQRLRERYWLRVHVLAIALVTLVVEITLCFALMHAGIDSLPLRYAIALPIAYGFYLLLLRWWAGRLAHDDSPFDRLDGLDDGGLTTTAWDGAPSATEALDAVGAADEGALVLVPLVAVLAVLGLLAALIGTGLFALFGVEVLLSVAVELAIASLAGSVAYKGYAEGWLATARRHTWKPALAMLALGIALGAAIDHWMPEARSLPHAIDLMRAGR